MVLNAKVCSSALFPPLNDVCTMCFFCLHVLLCLLKFGYSTAHPRAHASAELLLCSALLTICYKAELSAPVTIFSCLRARGKRCSGKVCTAEKEKKDVRRERMQMRTLDKDKEGERAVERQREGS